MRGITPPRMMRLVGTTGALLVLLGGRVHAQAGIVSTAIGTTLNAAKNAALSVTVVSGGVQTIPSLTDGAINTFASPVRITTTWALDLFTVSNIHLIGYFTNPTQALSNGTTGIPASAVQGRMATGLPTTFTSFTQAGGGGVGTAGGSLELFREFVFLVFNRAGTRTDDLELRLDLTAQAPLAAGTYAGTLYLRAVVY